MRAEKVVAALLSVDAGVQALVADRIYGGVAPQEAQAPLVVFRKASAAREAAIDFAQTPEIVTAQIDVLVCGVTYQQMKDLGEAVRLAVAYRAEEIIAGVDVKETSVEAEGADDYDPDTKEHMQVWTFQVIHTE